MSMIVRFYTEDGENGYLSNWYTAPFTYAGKEYFCAEQYMMEQKAVAFGDEETAKKIMEAKDPGKAKSLGREVHPFNKTLWEEIRVQIMRRGIRAKFQQNPELLVNLLGTGNALLAECSASDTVWGVGLSLDDPASEDPRNWKGHNLLGRTLMLVRDDLRAWCAAAGEKVTEYADACELKQPKPIRAKRRGNRGHEDNYEPVAVKGDEQSVWSLPIYEACMIPGVEEIIAPWLETARYIDHKARTYSAMSMQNYTFEELEQMFRRGKTGAYPMNGFYEMKQDLFDMLRYQGNLRNPAAILTNKNRDEEAERLEAEKAAEMERLEAEKAAEMERVQAEEKAEIERAKAEEAAALKRAEEARQAALAARYHADRMKAMAQAAFERAKKEADAKAKAEEEARERAIAKAKEEAARARKEAELQKQRLEEHKKETARKEETKSAPVRTGVAFSQGKIFENRSECIVNVTTTTLSIGKGVDDEFYEAGGAELKRACMAIKGCETGKAVMTVGGALPAKYVIHTACPRYGGDGSDKKYLEKCYNSILDLAMAKNIHEIAIPPIGTGYFGFPLRECAVVASQTVDRWMLKHTDYPVKVNFVCPDQRTEAMFRSLRK